MDHTILPAINTIPAKATKQPILSARLLMTCSRPLYLLHLVPLDILQLPPGTLYTVQYPQL